MSRIRKHSTKKALTLGIIYIVSVFFALIGLSYAFFTANVEGNEEASSAVIETADLRLVYTDGVETIKMLEALPGQSIAKTFTVENLGNIEVEYTIDLVNVTNTFVGGELVYSLESDNEGATATREALRTDDGVLKTASIAPGVVQTYTIEVLFLETGSDQNHNQGAKFSGLIHINTNKKYTSETNMSLMDKILSSTTPLSDENINFSQTANEGNTNGLYYTADNTVELYGEDNERIYYYRGEVENNWVSFAGYLWRIVRTTSEGGIKLVYSGDATGESSAFIGKTSFNNNSNNKYYVGYTYNTDLNGYNSTQTNSTIKSLIDDWYKAEGEFSTLTTKLSDYETYISKTAIYCSDKSSEEEDSNNWIYYPSYSRIINNSRPTYNCSETNNSRYTVENSSGNGLLTNPIALLSVDEIVYAGISVYSEFTSYLIDNTADSNWWSMSPINWDGQNASIWSVYTSNSLSYDFAIENAGVRPSISLKSCVTVVGNGDGSKQTPYEISDDDC